MDRRLARAWDAALAPHRASIMSGTFTMVDGANALLVQIAERLDQVHRDMYYEACGYGRVTLRRWVPKRG